MTMTGTRALLFAVATLPISVCAPAPVVGEPVPSSSTTKGAALYQDRCASCHGSRGKGDGPVVSALPPPDLNTIAKRAGGTFPAPRVSHIITFGGDIAAHGTRVMPVWGMIFSAEACRGRRGALQSRRAIVELLRYLQSIQQK